MLALYIIAGIILLIVVLLHFPIVASINLSNEKFDMKIKWLFVSLYPLKPKKPGMIKKVRKPKKQKKLSRRKRKQMEKELEEEKKAYQEILNSAKLTSDEIFEHKEENENSEIHKDETDEKQPKEKRKKSDNLKFEKEEKFKDKIEEYKEKWHKIKPYIPLGKKVLRKLIKAIKIRDLDLHIEVADEDAYECAMKYGKVNALVYNALAVLKQFFTVTVKHIEIESRFDTPESNYRLDTKIKVLPSTLISIIMFILVKFIYTNIKLKEKNKFKKRRCV